jgi:hypothetical protein
MATETERIQKITNDLEAAHQALRRAARNISGLLAVGRAACDEIKAYNLWALALYNTQRGMLTSLRAAGENNVPELPPYPTLFAWKGVAGSEAWRIDCNAGEQNLTGALRDAMASDRTPQYLSTNEIAIVTTDQNALRPEDSPDLATLVNVTNGSLGAVPVVWIVVAGLAVAIGLSVGLVALSRYLTEKSIQEETSSRTRIQAEAFDKYTSARMSCYADCTARGNDVATCASTCAKLVDKPNLKIDPARPNEGLGIFGTVGLIAVAAAGGVGLWKLYQKKSDRAYTP